jgi:DNA helicase-2/ATP-dependent DNA helicase PcrA
MLVDEFQDLTPAHLLLIRLLSAPGGAVFGVGDDDQTIYGYNGADPAWLIDFAELFPGSGEHPLEVNYRCPAGIVDVVDRLLRHNARRVAKTIRAASNDTGGWSVDTGVDAVGASSNAVDRALSSGAAPSDVAVLARVNALLAPVQVALAANGVPISGGVGLEFADRTAVRTVLAWLRLAVAGRGGALDAADIREALRRPSRSFHPRITDWVSEQTSVVDLNRLAGRRTNERDAERVVDFAADVQTLQKMVAAGATTSEVILALIDEIGLAGSVASLDANRRGTNRAAQGDDLTAVTHLAALHDDPTSFERWMRGHLAVKRSADGVLLSTVHRVKGQEWPHVVVHLAAADQYPHRLAEDVEEERRLFHVAITRASSHASIVTGADPSPFVAELTTEPTPGRVVSSHRPEPAAVRKAASSSGSSGDPGADLDEAGQRRYAALRDLRNELRDGKPAYVVFDNKTLAAIARQAPTTLRDLGRISGIGPAKLERYGVAVITLIANLG